MAEFKYLSGTLIACNTCEGFGIEEEHAEPLETQIPFSSNLKINSELFSPSKETLTFPGNLFSIEPFILKLFGISF